MLAALVVGQLLLLKTDAAVRSHRKASMGLPSFTSSSQDPPAFLNTTQTKADPSTLAKEVLDLYQPVKMDWFRAKDLYMFPRVERRQQATMQKLVDLREAFICRNVLQKDSEQCLFEGGRPKLLPFTHEMDGKRFACTIQALGSVTLLSDLDFTISCNGPAADNSGSDIGPRECFDAETSAAKMFFQRSRTEVLGAVTEPADETQGGVCDATWQESKCLDPVPAGGSDEGPEVAGLSVSAALYSVLRGMVETSEAIAKVSQWKAKSLQFVITRKAKTGFLPATEFCCKKVSDAYTKFFSSAVESTRKQLELNGGKRLKAAKWVKGLKDTAAELDVKCHMTDWAKENRSFEQKLRTQRYLYFLEAPPRQQKASGFCYQTFLSLLMANEAYWVSGAVSDVVRRQPLRSRTEGLESVMMNLGYALEHLVGEILKGLENRADLKFFGTIFDAHTVYKRNVGDGLIKFGKYMVRVHNSLKQLVVNRLLDQSMFDSLMHSTILPFRVETIAKGDGAYTPSQERMRRKTQRHSAFQFVDNFTVEKMIYFGERMLKLKKEGAKNGPFGLPDAYMKAYNELFEKFPGPQIKEWDAPEWHTDDWEKSAAVKAEEHLFLAQSARQELFSNGWIYYTSPEGVEIGDQSIVIHGERGLHMAGQVSKGASSSAPSNENFQEDAAEALRRGILRKEDLAEMDIDPDGLTSFPCQQTNVKSIGSPAFPLNPSKCLALLGKSSLGCQGVILNSSPPRPESPPPKTQRQRQTGAASRPSSRGGLSLGWGLASSRRDGGRVGGGTFTSRGNNQASGVSSSYSETFEGEGGGGREDTGGFKTDSLGNSLWEDEEGSEGISVDDDSPLGEEERVWVPGNGGRWQDEVQVALSLETLLVSFFFFYSFYFFVSCGGREGCIGSSSGGHEDSIASSQTAIDARRMN
uniref:Uncharacterized protein n=1 Tax=Chromera velia CCMP2878 TaxID=1169474 RepID=A0A0G4IEP2_9ALVE|eukprot:Cvel_13693.t1-p1 / transcript=Cvel_13693.t1 / gene=Cvel_13693 / organism=Chromera_velia_CCMP2878 / gene_product=hypothetical protein / transcript_product=hypothetical protein / location=Cvel_scaffold946:107-10671(-) / protein_length=921 / sequence_SO=supercontig / SO=protein_coding / is_pseudo=false